ncbi:lysine--tRNA ligase [Candidatus Halobeggiatoa sp. HSG11]|nr:lysine--tRNA ligase [Candidatus Halobeggiatoa sp. HSG11]
MKNTTEDTTEVRISKMQNLLDSGLNAYPDRYECTHTIGELKGLEEGITASMAGRVLSVRRFGKLMFVTIGNAINRGQISLKKNELEEDDFNLFMNSVDLGDFVGVYGQRYTTKKGEPTLGVKKWTFLSKSLRPLPDKYHGIKDSEARLKQRYLSTCTDSEVADIYIKRAKLKQVLRSFLEKHHFIEIDTPAIQIQKSGALARSFKTHHNALDIDAELRIAPETYLKRALVGGFERVYEIATCFRNEGMSLAHWPEFHMLEFYAAYWNFEDLINFTEIMLKHVIDTIVGNNKIIYQEQEIDFSGDWPRLSFRELLIEKADIDINAFPTIEGLRAEIINRNLLDAKTIANLGRGSLIDELYKKTARPSIINPTFLVGHPIELSPLARNNDNDASIVDRFQLVVNGWEVVNAYSELADPIEQRKRFEVQAAAVQSGDENALDIDEDFLLALEHGMPPAAGWGMGIERILALLTDSSNIKDTIMFPIHR